MSHFIKGNLFYREKKFRKAVESYEEYIKLQPNSFSCHENLGLAYSKLGDSERSKTYFEKALLLNQKSPMARYYLHKGEGVTTTTFYDASHPVELMKAVSKQANVVKLTAESTEANKKIDDFALYRIIGNDLFPRHEIGQTRRNVRFILENEPSLEHCKKIWVLNRIVDKTERGKLIEMLQEFNQEFLEIPFIEKEYQQIDIDLSTLPTGFLESNSFKKKGQGTKERIITTIYRKKNNYAMNNNGARNFALNHGRQNTVAKWVLPWDGNCFMTKPAWEKLRQDIAKQKYFKYFSTPMERVPSNEVLSDDGYEPDPREEPQLIFRYDSTESFNEEFSYGRRPKVETLWRLGIPGLWDDYKDDPWDPKRRDLSPEAKEFGVAGWTARLFSGMGAQEKQNQEGARSRFSARQVAIVSMLDNIDKNFGKPADMIVGLSDIKNSMVCSSTNGIEDLRSKFNKKHFIYVNRNDGLGERLKAILNGLYLSKILHLKFKFSWSDKLRQGNEFHDIEPVEKVFSKGFISKYFVNYPDESTSSLSIDELFENNFNADEFSYIHCDQRDLQPYLKRFNVQLDNEFIKIYKDIDFSEAVNNAISKAYSIDLKTNLSAAVHVRGGDIIYGRYRLTERYQRKAVPFSLIKYLSAHLVKANKQPIIFYQDNQLDSHMDKVKDVLIAKKLMNGMFTTSLEEAFFEITLMSRCSEIYAGTSGFAGVASRISAKAPLQVDKMFDVHTLTNEIKKDITSNFYDEYQNSFAWLMYVIYGKQSLSKDEILFALDRGVSLDPSNSLLYAKKLLTFLEYSELQNANNLLKDVIFPEFGTNVTKNSALFALGSVRKSRLTFDVELNSFLQINTSSFFYLDVLKIYISYLMGHDFKKLIIDINFDKKSELEKRIFLQLSRMVENP